MDCDSTAVIVNSKENTKNVKERGNWSSKTEFLFSGLSYAVGLGNIWRFPYLVYRNGGGAFFIPYVVMLLFVGLPLFLLELAFGQYASEGPITVWKICPLFQGIGYAMFIMSGLVGIYYNMILAWALYYLYSSFTTNLPWNSCDNVWNTIACRKFDNTNCTAHHGHMNSSGVCLFRQDVKTEEEWIALSKVNTKMPSDEYFHNFVLNISSGIEELGNLQSSLAICLAICWLIVFICLARGVKSMGKVVYFTALFPYIVLTSLLIRALTLPGSMEGIKFYLTPDWNRLKSAAVWADAAMQIFFSLSPCWGGLITLASYNKFHNNFYGDTMFIAFGNCLTSFYAGFVIFGIVGFMANELSLPVSQVASQGPGLAFIAYPEAVSRFPLAPVWSILFFVMLLTLGLGTQFTLIETVVTTIVDTWPKKLRKRKRLILGLVCFMMFIFGLLICFEGGIYILQLMDNYCASFSALFIGLCEVIIISWIYGVDRFLENCKSMLGHYPYQRLYWKIIWKYVCPSMIIFILLFSLIDLQPVKYGDYYFPDWSVLVGWTLSFISVSTIPMLIIYQLIKERGSFLERIKWLIKPSSDWGIKQLTEYSCDEEFNDRNNNQNYHFSKNRLNKNNKKDLNFLSPNHIDSQVPLASNYDDLEDEEEENEAENLYKDTNEHKKINFFKNKLKKNNSFDNSKKYLYIKQNLTYQNDDLWPSFDDGLKLNLSSNSNKAKSNINQNDLVSKDKMKINETNF